MHTAWDTTTKHHRIDTSPCQGKYYTVVDLGPHWHVTDVNFLDEKELALLLQYDDDDSTDDDDNASAGSYLAAIGYDGLMYNSLDGSTLSPSFIVQPLRLVNNNPLLKKKLASDHFFLCMYRRMWCQDICISLT